MKYFEQYETAITLGFKKKIVLEALKEGSAIHELADKYEIPARLIADWKKQFLDYSENAFNPHRLKEEWRLKNEKFIEQLCMQICQLKIENEFLKMRLRHTTSRENAISR